jgi:hypothetical protein
MDMNDMVAAALADDDGLAVLEGPPPDTGLFVATPPEAGAGDCDTWGNIRLEPVKTVNETHGENCVHIFVYQLGGAFYFGFQIKIDRVVRQKRANIKDIPHATAEGARAAARNMIIGICKENHAIKKLFADFTVIRYDQPELF